jgi:hypothetical protein
MNPTATDGRGATAIEKLIDEGFRLHGHPVVWREKLLKAREEMRETIQTIAAGVKA